MPARDVTSPFTVLALCCAVTAGCGWAVRLPQTVVETKPPERERISPADQVHTAYHEAAHAVIDVLLLPERGVDKLTVFSRVSERRWGVTVWDPDVSGHDARWYRGVALAYYAGNAAEEILFKKAPPEDDTDADNSAFIGLALCKETTCACPAESRIGDHCLFDGWMASQRPILYAASKRCVEANLDPIMSLAELVLLKPEARPEYERSLSKKELADFFASHRLKPCPEP